MDGNIENERNTGRILMASLFLPYSYTTDDMSIYKNCSIKRMMSNSSIKMKKEQMKLKMKNSQKFRSGSILRLNNAAEKESQYEKINIRPSMLGNIGLQNAIASVTPRIECGSSCSSSQSNCDSMNTTTTTAETTTTNNKSLLSDEINSNKENKSINTANSFFNSSSPLLSNTDEDIKIDTQNLKSDSPATTTFTKKSTYTNNNSSSYVPSNLSNPNNNLNSPSKSFTPNNNHTNHTNHNHMKTTTTTNSSSSNTSLNKNTNEEILRSFDLIDSKKVWFGLPGEQTMKVTRETKAILTKKLKDYDCIPIFVKPEQYEGHYNQVCKQILWKTFHYQLPEYPKGADKEQQWWCDYKAVNQKFANIIAENYRPGDIIWINDYHLMFLPKMLRELLPDAPIGFFLHIPFPSSEIIRCLYARDQILNGLLGADLIGFQTYPFMRHFLSTISRLLGYESTPSGIQLENSIVSVGIFPIGIDLDSINEKRKEKPVLDIVNNLLERYSGMKLIIGRDKNDHVKGVRHKLAAFEKFLYTYPEWIGKVVLIQVALSTAEQNELENQVGNLVARINSKFGSLGYSPVVYLQQDIPYEQYLALLTIADVFLITSIRDGMNLTSHEYVACQKGNYSPLIISEFAGTYGSFGSSVMRVNPWDYREVATALYESLTMSEEEKETRWNELYTYIRTNSAQFFVESFVNELLLKYTENQKRKAQILPRLKLDTLSSVWTSSLKRLLFIGLDRDKILSNNQDMKTVKNLIFELLKDPINHIYLLSDASKDEMKKFVSKSNLTMLSMIAEDGCFIKKYDQDDWELTTSTDTAWKKHILKILEFYTDRMVGSYIEQRNYSVIWHYENSNYESYSWQISEFKNHIQSVFSSNYPIRVLQKQKSIVITPRNINKGSIVRKIMEREFYDADLVFCVGDDESDESMFDYCRLLQDKMNSMQVPRINSPLNTTTNYYYNGASSPILSMTSKSSTSPNQGGLFGFSTSPSSSFKRYTNNRNQYRRRIITCAIDRKFTKAKYTLSRFDEVLPILEELAKQPLMSFDDDEENEVEEKNYN